MKSVAEMLEGYRSRQAPLATGRVRPPNRERIALIEELLRLMGEETPTKEEDALLKQDEATGTEAYLKRLDRRIKYWLGRTRGRSDSWIRDTMKQARTGTNPPALFNYLLKK